LLKAQDDEIYYKDTQEIIILVGYPASGKTTWATEKLQIPSETTDKIYYN
jgi:hypothetical protein